MCAIFIKKSLACCKRCSNVLQKMSHFVQALTFQSCIRYKLVKFKASQVAKNLLTRKIYVFLEETLVFALTFHLGNLFSNFN